MGGESEAPEAKPDAPETTAEATPNVVEAPSEAKPIAEEPAEAPAAAAPTRASTWREWLELRGPDGRGLTLRSWLVVLAVVVVACRCLAFLEPFVMLVPPMLALAIAVPTLGTAVRLARRDPSTRRTLRFTEPALVSLAFAALTWSVWSFVLRGVPIDSGDHQIMAARAEAFTEALRHGHWLHWTHMMQGGDSLVDFYPIFANLLTAVVHIVLAKRTTPFVYTYSVIVVFGWWLRGVTAYHLARRFSSPLVSFAIAIGAVFEVGKDVWDGVWNGTIYWGMIHNNIALSFGLLAAAAQVDTTRRAVARNVVRTALWTAVTAFAHPLGIIFSTLTTASAGAAALFAKSDRRRAVWAMAGSALGVLIAGIWVFPFTHALRTLGYSNALPGEGWGNLGRGLLSGELPTSSFGGFIGLAMFAVAASVASRRVPVMIPSLVALLLWLLALTPLMIQIRILDFFPSFLDGQQRRMLTVLKTASIPALAWGASRVMPRRLLGGTLRPRDVLARTVLLGLLVYGPLRAVIVGVGDIGKELVSQVPRKSADLSERPHAGADHEAIFAWLKQKRLSDPSATPWRVGILWDHRMRHAAWVEGFRTGVPMVDYINVPANFLTIRPRERTLAGFHDWNMRYATTDQPKEPAPGSTKIMTEGQLTLWELPGYDDRFVVGPAGVKITNLVLDGDDVRFHVEGAPAAGADLTVRMAWFPRWEATAGGQTVAVKAVPPHPGAKPKQEQVGIHVGNGDVVLRCSATMPRFWLGLFATLLGLAGTIFVATEARRQRVEAWARRLLDRAEASGRRALANATALPPRRRLAIAGFAVVILVGAVVHGSSRLVFPPLDGVGLSARVIHPDGREQDCTTGFPSPSFVCKDGSVTPTLGSTGRGDDTGEFGVLWTGMRIAVEERGGSVVLHAPRFHGGGKPLPLHVSTYGAFRLSGTYGGHAFGPVEVDGDQTVDVPIGDAFAGALDLRFEAKIPHAHVTVAQR